MDLSKIKKARFIKLGEGGKWEKLCVRDATLRFGYYDVPHELGLKKDRTAIRDFYVSTGCTPGTAADYARQILEFYDTSEETLWVTFIDGYLWWAIASKPVEYLGNDKIEFPEGSRLRRTTSGWHNESSSGKKLHMTNLSGKLTKSAAYRQTICSINDDAFEYLLRVLKDENHPEVEKALSIRAELLKSTERLITNLSWQDFEIFADLIFSNSGWRRISMIGGQQKTLDMEMILPTTKERAVVQVKSKTTQQELDNYIELCKDMPARYLFYVYHSSAAELSSQTDGVIVMGPESLAEQALSNGLLDWLIEKTG